MIPRPAIGARLFALTCSLFLTAQIIAAPGPTPAVAGFADPENAGRELAARLRAAAPAKNSEFHGTLLLRQRGVLTNSIPLRSQITLGDSSWQVTYETSGDGNTPAEKLAIIHAPGQPNRYLHTRATNATARPGPPEPLQTGPFTTTLAGSDFALADLGLEFFHWPGQRLLKHEMTRSRSCRVLESVNPRPAPGAYTRVVSWIDVETDGLIRAEAYDSANRLVKEFILGSFEKVDGEWQLRNLKIRSPRTRRETVLEFDLSRK